MAQNRNSLIRVDLSTSHRISDGGGADSDLFLLPGDRGHHDRFLRDCGRVQLQERRETEMKTGISLYDFNLKAKIFSSEHEGQLVSR